MIPSQFGSSDSNLTNNKASKLNIQSVVPPSLVLTVESRVMGSPYYTTISNSPYYIAIKVTSHSSNNVKISAITLDNNINNVYEISDPRSSGIYGSTPCIAGDSITPSNSCEIMVHLANQNTNSPINAKLSVTANGIKYQKTLIRNSYAYIAGAFSQIYASSNNPGISPIHGDGNCGINNDSLCQIVVYDLVNKTIQTVATTDNVINDMVVDNDGNIYAAGNFESASSDSKSINAPNGSYLILKIDPSINGEISDFIQSITTGNPSYPNGFIYAMQFNNNQNKLYMTGAFDSIADINSASGYPIAHYDFKANKFENTLGNDINNPNFAVTALGFDDNDNLYVSGFYDTISNTQFNDGMGSNLNVNKCTLNNSYYTCYNDSNSVLNISTLNGQLQPAYGITTQENGGMYIVGGFNTINANGISLLTANSSLLAFNDLSIGFTSPGAWSNIADNMDNPDNAIAFVKTYDNNKFYTGGEFSSIGGITPDGNAGTCGANSNSSCLLAKYDGTTWNKVLTTDGIINAFVTIDGINAK